MNNWIATLLGTEEAKNMQREYKLLLSAGLSECDAEDEVISFFISDATVSEQGILWVLFALIQWNMGRMSKKVYSIAKQWLNSTHLSVSSEVILAVDDVLNAPMPRKKKFRKLRTIKCPWRKGALLAYKISTNANKKTSRFWNKYVLLRVVEIKKWPVSAIKPDLLFDESMYVALYNWVGESVPDASALENLEYTPISFNKPLTSQLSTNRYLDCFKNIVGSTRQNMEFSIEYTDSIYALDWGNERNASAVFSEIYDDTNGTRVFDIDHQATRVPPLIGTAGFDTVLIKRLEQLFPENSGDGPIY